MGLDMKTRQKLTEETAKRYCIATKKRKTRIIDEFCATTGYNRKYAIHILKNSAFIKTTFFNNREKRSVKVVERRKRKRVYKPKYGNEVRREVVRLWEYSMRMCAKRLVPFIRDNLDYLAHLNMYSDKTKLLLGEISAATIGRILKPEIYKGRLKGKSTTRPAMNLSALIPIRVYFDWDERRPGFFEMDTVAHCGASAAGEYVKSLTLVDVYSGWTENRALLNSAHRWTTEGVENIRDTIPFVMLGLDGDNGSEFKNMQMLQWCAQNNIKLTRSRPYRKNDNCFVEQKNDSVVRRITGYQRFEGEEARRTLAMLYESYNKLVNYFFPSMKIISKERVDAKLIKRYDSAKTPFKRLLESEHIDEETKSRLKQIKETLDLDTLLKNTKRLQDKLMSLAVPWK